MTHNDGLLPANDETDAEAKRSTTSVARGAAWLRAPALRGTAFLAGQTDALKAAAEARVMVAAVAPTQRHLVASTGNDWTPLALAKGFSCVSCSHSSVSQTPCPTPKLLSSLMKRESAHYRSSNSRSANQNLTQISACSSPRQRLGTLCTSTSAMPSKNSAHLPDGNFRTLAPRVRGNCAAFPLSAASLLRQDNRAHWSLQVTPFPRTLQTAPPPLPSPQVTAYEPETADDILEPWACQRMVQHKEETASDLRHMRAVGMTAKRTFSNALALGRSAIKPEARDIEWDVRPEKRVALPDGSMFISPTAYAEPIATHLNLDFLR